MESRICCFVFTALQLMSLASATSRSLAPNHGIGANKQVTGQSQSTQSYQVPLGSKQGLIPNLKGIEGGAAAAEVEVGVVNQEAFYKGMGKLGSSPPSCDHKCYGCTPCEAIQVPTTTKTHLHFGVNYANYEPEGWKCKCGPSFYSP